MLIYSKKIIQFVAEITQAVKSILSKEIGLHVLHYTFDNRSRTRRYSIKIVIFNHLKMAGYFDSDFYELGFHECLMHVSKEQLHNVIRHELAHYITFIEFGKTNEPHGIHFQSFCRQMRWSEAVSKATICLEGGQGEVGAEESSLLRKVKKLMALSNSSNEMEAEQAMIKSQQLLLKYNLDAKYIGGHDEEKMILIRILKQSKKDAKLIAIGRILATFFVSIVYHRGDDFICLEVLGLEENVKIAEYVASILQTELNHLWQVAKKTAQLKGAVAKNSFFVGIASGYCQKIEALKKGYNQETSHAIIVIEKQLVDAKTMAYRHLVNARSSGSYCEKAADLGKEMGRNLNINAAINKSSHSTKYLELY